MNQHWKIPIRIIYSLYLVLHIFLLPSCNRNICKTFDYKNLGIDTNYYKNNLYYFNNKGDTIYFKCVEAKYYNKSHSEPNMNTMDECNNGSFFKYKCPQLDIQFNNSFIIRSNKYFEYSFNAHLLKKDTMILHSIKEVSFELKNTTKIDHDFQYVRIIEGKFVKFIDSKGIAWNLVLGQ